MIVIKPSSELRNNYNEISMICHQSNDPVYITRNGEGDLAVMSIEVYEKLVDRYNLYNELKMGIVSIDRGEKLTSKEVYSELSKI